MASIKLLAIEQRKKGLPDACAQCGEPAEEWIRRTGYWTPDWIYVFLLGGLVLVLIVYLIVRKEIRFILPFCEEHKNHWRNRTWLLVGTFPGILGFLLVGTVAAAYSKPNSAVGGVILLVGVLLFTFLGCLSDLR